MYKAEYYDFSGNEGKRIKEDLKNWGFHHLTISRLPADFFRMSKSQLEKLFEHASDAFIARMYDVPEQKIQNRRDDFGIKQLTNTLNRMEREDEAAQIFKEILRIVSNEYNNGNIPHTNSTPLNSEKEFLYMKATGIVRRIDDLGRIVIPKEIRRTLRLHEGVPMEIFTDREGEVILKKYSPMAEMGMHAKQYAEALAQVSGRAVLITDRDQVIAASGAGVKDAVGKSVSRELEQLIANRDNRLSAKGEREFVPILRDEDEGAEQEVVTVILSEGDAIGAVVLLEKNPKQKMGLLEQKLALTAAGFLGRQMEG